MNDRQLVLDTVEEICADTNNIDEVCMALEHSTIFATEMIQNLVEVIDKYKSTINKIKEYCNKQIEIAKENITNSEQWLKVEECHLSAKQDIHTGKLIKRENEKILELLEEVE